MKIRMQVICEEVRIPVSYGMNKGEGEFDLRGIIGLGARHRRGFHGGPRRTKIMAWLKLSRKRLITAPPSTNVRKSILDLNEPSMGKRLQVFVTRIPGFVFIYMMG